MKKNKFWIFLGILIVIFFGLIFWPNNQNKSTKDKVIIDKLTEPTADFGMDSPLKIGWGNISSKNYEKADALLTEKKIFDSNQKIKIRSDVFDINTEKTSFFNFDENRNSFEYSKDVKERKQIEKGNLSVTDIYAKFTDTVMKFNEFTQLESKAEQNNYKKFLSPWWVTGSESDFDAIEILANYNYKNIPIKSFNGFLVKAIYFTNGKLAKMEFQMPFDKIVKSSSKKLLSLSEIKNLSLNKFKIWKIDGGQEYELSGETANINEVNITNYNLEYIYDIKTGVVWPYYFFKGTSQLTTGQAEITLIVSAVKE